MKKNSVKFSELQRKWYALLKEEGFEDIEEKESSLEMLKSWHCAYFQKRYTPQTFEFKERYYQLASQFLYESQFESMKDEIIWKMHSDGQSIREIAKVINLDINKIYQVILRYKKLMLDAI